MTPPPNTPPSDPTAPPERKLGLNLAAALDDFLRGNGVSPEVSSRLAVSFVAGLADADTLRDASGRVWAQVPIFDPQGNVLPFDERNVAALEATAASVLMNSPEAAAVFAGVVYPSAFREAKIGRLLWLGRAGEVTEPADIFNSLDAVAMLHEAMFVRLAQRRQFEQKQVAELLARQVELRQGNDTLEQVNEQLRAKTADLTADLNKSAEGGP